MKNVKPILLASICLNLVLIGLIVGGSLRGHNMRPKNGPTDEIAAIMYSAPQEMRKELRNQFKGIASKRDKDEGQRAELKDIILQTPFDADQLSAYFETRRGKNTEIAKTAHSKLVESIAKLSDDERAELAKNLNKHPKRRDQERKNHN